MPSKPMEHRTMNSESYLNDRQIAARYGVHRTTPWRWAKDDPSFPKPIKLGGATRWRLSDLEEWEAQRPAS